MFACRFTSDFFTNIKLDNQIMLIQVSFISYYVCRPYSEKNDLYTLHRVQKMQIEFVFKYTQRNGVVNKPLRSMNLS